MATKNLTQMYLKYRSATVLSQSYFDTDDERRPFRDVELGEIEDLGGKEFWEEILDYVNIDVEEIKRRMKKVEKLHTEHLIPRTSKSVEEASSEEIKIETHTAEIQNLFQQCKKNISELQKKTESRTSDVLLNNLKMKLVTELSELSKDFRTKQQNYLQGLKELKMRRKSLNAVSSYMNDDDDDAEQVDEMIRSMDRGFTEEQQSILRESERDVIRRDKELKDVLKSIFELHELFKDFSTLVVEQGSMLDRIDFNIERTANYISRGNKSLKSAEKLQKGSRWLICLLFLIVIFILIGVGVLIKLGLKYGTKMF